MKAKRCRHCKQAFTPVRPLQTVCSPICALELIDKRKAKEQTKQEKIERQRIKERKLELKPIQYWLKRTEKAVNAYVVARDRSLGHGCISCGTYDAQAFHAGHFLSVGASSYSRFDADRNIHMQCSKCNLHLSGNLTNYEIGLVARIGAEEVDKLKNAPRVWKWSREALQGIEATYKAKIKALSSS